MVKILVQGRDGWTLNLRRQEKNRIYLLTFVDRATRCILAWMVRYKRNGYEFQEMLANSAPGHDYYSDDYEAY